MNRTIFLSQSRWIPVFLYWGEIKTSEQTSRCPDVRFNFSGVTESLGIFLILKKIISPNTPALFIVIDLTFIAALC